MEDAAESISRQGVEPAGGGCQHHQCHDEHQGPAAALTPEGAKALLPKTLTLTSGSETG